MELIHVGDNGRLGEEQRLNSTTLITRTSRSSIFRSFRKLSTIICILEAVIIILFTVYFIRSYNSPEHVENPASGGVNYQFLPSLLPKSYKNAYRVYSNGVNSTNILVGAIKGCNQRIHDLKFGVPCKSSQAQKCSIINADGLAIELNAKKLNDFYRATKITSSKSGSRFQVEEVNFERVNCSPKKGDPNSDCKFKTILKVYPNEPNQQIIGWGGALTDSSINNILGLSTNGTQRLLDDYFGPNGLRYNMIRITIGGSDFSSRFYTNDDLKSGEDLRLKRFKLMEEDTLLKIPMLKYIQNEFFQQSSERPLKLFASMWSPPTWLKTNNHFNKGQLKGSIGPVGSPDDQLFDERYYRALAELKKKFLLAYMNESVKFWGLTVMNEPIFAVQPFLDFNTMIFAKNDYGNYIAKYLGPAIKEDERLQHIRLIAHDDNRRYLMNFTDAVLEMPKVRDYIDGVSTHGYADEDYHLLDWIAAKHSRPGNELFVLPNELCSAHLPFMEKALIGNWPRGIHYALDIIRGLQHSAGGWVDWNMALDTSGGPGWLGGRLDSPVIVDKLADTYYKSPMFYALGHFSRYIPPRSVRVGSVISNDLYDYQLETVTFHLAKGDDLATVIVNNNPYEVELIIDVSENGDGKSATYGTNLRQIRCDADSITTIIFKRATLN